LKRTIVIIGAGKVGSRLGSALYKNGYLIAAVVNKPYILAQKLGSEVSAGIVSEQLESIPEKEKIIFLCVEDSGINHVAESLSSLNNITERDFAIHTSGALTIDSLSPLKEKGCGLGSFHPMQTFPDISYSGRDFEGIYIGLEGDRKVKEVLNRIAVDLKSNTIEISSMNKVPYHLGGVFASNFLVCSLSVVKKIYQDLGISEKEMVNLLQPIIFQTVANMKTKGVEDSLTGPIARGDIKSVENHINYLETKSGELKNLYLEFSKLCIRIVKEKEIIEPQRLTEIEKLIRKDIKC